jgi:flagellar assembly factor FliW
VKISTTRFGDIDIDESRVIQMKGGILGFEHLKKYLLLMQDEKIPFWWFQSIEDGSVAFVVLNSFIVKPDYAPVISDSEVKLLGIESPDDVVLLSIVTIRSDPVKITANLRAPVVINIKSRLARQVVIQDTKYPVQYPVECPEAGTKEKLVKGEEKISNLAC